MTEQSPYDSTSTSPHVTEDALRAWLAEELDDNDAEALISHIEQCDACGELLDQVSPQDDSLAKSLRSVSAARASTDDGSEEGGTKLDGGAEAIAKSLSSAQRSRQRWKLLKLIAKGGIGEVWLARDLLLRRDVAVKRLKPEVARRHNVQRRFLYEARVTAQLNHPGTVQIFDLVDAGAESYYVMSLVKGKSLRTLIWDLHNEQPGDEVVVGHDLLALLRHWESVAQTIAFAHSRGILHRDIKSENVVVGYFDQVTVVDWGLAKRVGEDDAPPTLEEMLERMHSPAAPADTLPGGRMGTPAFMAPEQARGDIRSIDHRTDIYGLAAVLYEILTGRPPFDGIDSEQVMHDVCNQPVPNPQSLVPNIDGELARICLRSLEKDPADRHQTVAEFASEVWAWMDGESERQQAKRSREKLFDLSDDLMLVYNRERRIVWANTAWKRVLGWEPEELLGALPERLTEPLALFSSHEVSAQLDRGETATGIERPIVARDGSERWYSWTMTPVVDEGIVCAIGRDIDARLRREREYSRLLDAAPDATVVVDSDRIIRKINLQTTAMFGYAQDELLGKPIEVLMPERFQQGHPGHFEGYTATPTVREMGARSDLYAVDKWGHEFRVAVQISPVEMEEGMRFISSIRRIDEKWD
ncbi:protein kinase domain-containing protein [Aeoliella sp. SH292]|uniref:protein kinase domain-containing protein n=1 Tax=Aeoliella sp. SH292 TaxID=3454464 RepID=UPI003F96323C